MKHSTAPSFVLAVVLTVVLVALVSSAPAQAVEIRTSYASLQSFLEKQAFTDKQRYYLVGSSRDKCHYGYLEEPRVRAKGGRVLLTMHFSGRLGKKVLGNCVGPGEAFDVTFSGVPTARGERLVLGGLRLDDLDGVKFFEDEIKDFLNGKLPKLVDYNLGDELRRRLADSNASSPYQVKLHTFEVKSLRAEATHLVLEFDLHVEVATGR